MRPLLPSVGLMLLAALGPACAYETVVTAARVPVPVLVGPVQRIGAAPTPTPKSKAFDVKVDHTFLVASSNNGYTTTTTTTHVREGTGKVDAALRKANGGALDRAVHVDEVRVRAFSGFALSTAWISSRVRLEGSMGETLVPMAHDGVTQRPEPESDEAVAPPEPIQPVPQDDGLIEPFAFAPVAGAR